MRIEGLTRCSHEICAIYFKTGVEPGCEEMSTARFKAKIVKEYCPLKDIIDRIAVNDLE